jgi:tellurite resistance protein TehA-like permease
MNAMWLLPVVTLIVASSSGGVVANALQEYSPIRAFETVTLSAFLVTVGLSLALMILTIYLLRLITHGLPPDGTVLSVFLPLGPTGQSGYAVLLIGQNYRTLFPTLSTANFTGDTTSATSAGIVVDIVCTCLSFILWSLATMWILYALLAIYTALRKSPIAFRVSFWGLVFPNVCLLCSSLEKPSHASYSVFMQTLQFNWATCSIRGPSASMGQFMPSGPSSYGSPSSFGQFGS